MKDEYNSQECAVCSAPADGLHYGAISCRSCNAFFRRTVVEKSEYRCKHTNTCVIDPDGRCACRSCRFTKCIEAGMKVNAVQPRRDPTGSQKERRKRNGLDMNSNTSSPQERSSNSISSEVQTPMSTRIDSVKSIIDDGVFTPPQRRPSNEYQSPPDSKKRFIKVELDEFSQPSTSSARVQKPYSRQGTPTEDQQQEFNHLVFAYGEHQRMMQLSFSTFEQFLDEHANGQKLRKMDPVDVSKLSAVELTGLLYWIEKQQPYTELPNEDKSSLLKRYSVRKLSLDHFYSASKHPEYCNRGEFVMNNFTFVPNDRTGFELPDDDPHQIQAKRETFAPTFNRFWSNVIHPFVAMKINDAEIVFLHIMLLWSVSNNEHVTKPTTFVMKTRRDWAMSRLWDWYQEHGTEEPALRMGQMIMMLGEIELICDMHCQDFQVAKLFEFCDMSKFWYETLCYAPCNTNVLKFDPNLLENLKRFTAINQLGQPNLASGVIEANTPLDTTVIKQEIKTENYFYGSPSTSNPPSNSVQQSNSNPPSNHNENHVIEIPIGSINPSLLVKPMDSKLANIDPALLVFNAHMLPSVMAALPDDLNYRNNALTELRNGMMLR